MTTKTAAKETTKANSEIREKRAQAIAAMNLVTRTEDRFRVGTPGLRNRQQFYEVWRDSQAKVRCNCLEFEENIAIDAGFRCEHILAVKHSLLAKTTEPAAMKQPAPLKPILPSETNGAQENATEERSKVSASERSELELGEMGKQSFETGRADLQAAIAARKALAKEAAEKKTKTVKFADTQDKKENTMKKENEKTASFAEIENQENEFEFKAKSNVVSMPFVQTLQALRSNVEPSVIKQREGWRDSNGNVHLVDYVEWHTVADILDRVAPQWSHTIRDIKQIGDSIAVTAAITIDGVTREGIGTGSADNEMGIKKAEHDALKRAAVKFGIARELYKRESDVIERNGAATSPTNNGGFPANPVAKSLADLVTPKQLGMIRALGRDAGVDIEEECKAVMSCKTDEMSKKAASAFIEHLQKIQADKQNHQPQKREQDFTSLRRVN
jgi:hypothetical protein